MKGKNLNKRLRELMDNNIIKKALDDQSEKRVMVILSDGRKVFFERISEI